MLHLKEKHFQLLDHVNYAQTQEYHDKAETYLQAWRKGIEDAGICLDMIACDLYYTEQGIDRPMCCGVWLDWVPDTT